MPGLTEAAAVIGAQNPVIWNVAIDFHHDAGCKRAGVLVDEGAENGALLTDQIPEDTGMDDQWEEVLMRPAQGVRVGFPVAILRRIVAGCIGIAIIAGTATASANVFSPSGVGAGNSNNVYPFDIGFLGISSQRYQQVYGSSDFGSSPITITGLAFTPAAGFTTPFSSILPDVDIFLSTTAAPVDGLSSTFAANL